MEWGVLIVFALALAGIFWTKTPGFGKFTTSVVILTLVLFVASMAFFMGKIEWQPLSNILFAIAGYAGGLIVSGKATDAK